MKKILVATSNLHKFNEIKNIARLYGFNNIEFVLADSKYKDNEPEENGSSFKENSYIKSKYYSDIYNLPTIGDDSGLCISHLDNRPGIYTARMFPGFTQIEKNNFLIKILHGETNRQAYFISNICYIDEKKNVFHFEGILNGKIDTSINGEGGFGYDPIFINDTLNINNGLLTNDQKDTISHRAIAIRKFLDFINEIK